MDFSMINLVLLIVEAKIIKVFKNLKKNIILLFLL